MMCSLLAGSLLELLGGTLVEEALAVSGLLVFESSFLVKMALAGRCLEVVTLVLPQFVDRPLPILEGAFCAGASLKKDGPTGQFLEAAGWWPVGLCKVLVGSIPCCKGDDQHCPGDLIFDNRQTPSQSGARRGGCDHLYCSHPEGLEREDVDKNELAVIQRSSFVEGKGGGLDSFILVPTEAGGT
jgi:hypothetical protein